MTNLQLPAALLGATIVGLTAQHLRIPGGLVLGAMVGAALATLLIGATEIIIPSGLSQAAFIVIGAAVGAELTRGTVRVLVPVLLPAVLAGALIIVAGLAIAYLLRAIGMAPPGDVLARSPGAINVMAAMAVEQNSGAVQVAAFHLVRLVMVLLSLPLLIRLLP